MKKVLLISVNQEKAPYPVAPLGLLYIAHALKGSGYDVSALDLCFSRDAHSDIKRTLKRECPDFVGVSLRNIDNLTFPQSVSYLPSINEKIQTIKLHTTAPIILGGSAFSLFPKEILSQVDVDFGIVGEGEKAFPELLALLNEGGSDLSSINNLVWRQNGTTHINKTLCLDHAVDSVLDHSLINNRKYMKLAGMANVQTKRGCSFKCSYCTYPLIEGKTYRLRSPDIVADEMSMLKKMYSISHVFFVDDIFTYPPAHAEAVCEALLKKKVKMRWSCFASPRGISKKLLTLMKKSGCTHIELGSDALSDKVLEKLRKPFTVKEILRSSRLCDEVGIKCAHYIILGAPGEDLVSLNEGLAMVQKLNNDAIIAMIGIRIYPNTELARESVKEGIITENTDLLPPRFYLSREMPADEMISMIKKFSSANSRCVVPGLRVRSSEEMYSVLRKHYREGPLWGYLN